MVVAIGTWLGNTPIFSLLVDKMIPFTFESQSKLEKVNKMSCLVITKKNVVNGLKTLKKLMSYAIEIHNKNGFRWIYMNKTYEAWLKVWSVMIKVWLFYLYYYIPFYAFIFKQVLYMQ